MNTVVAIDCRAVRVIHTRADDFPTRRRFDARVPAWDNGIAVDIDEKIRIVTHETCA
jgi:hypothetical protein